MNSFDLIKHGMCPNEHGDMVFFKTPIDLLYHIPEELLEPYEGKETPSGMFGYISAICQECGFTLGVKSIKNQASYLEWLEEYRTSEKS